MKKSTVKKICLSQGKSALVDSDHYEMLSKWKWCFHHTGYAVRTIKTKLPYGRRKSHMVFMHRVVNGTPKGMYTDHINGDKLDNRKGNLRSATKAQSSMNTSPHKKSSSRHKGVVFHKKLGKWQSQIRINGKQKHLGVFEHEDDAALAYNSAAKKHFGEFAKLNNVSA